MQHVHIYLAIEYTYDIVFVVVLLYRMLTPRSVAREAG